MKTLLIPALVWCVSTAGFAATESLVLPLILAPVCVPVVEAPPQKAERNRAGDRLEGLREQLGGLAKNLEETNTAVEEMARQRDEALEKAKQSAKAQRIVMEEAAALRKELAEARNESAQWKSKAAASEKKMQDGMMVRQELQNFRGELQGAMKEFQAMKRDFGQAREVLEDPVERAALKKEAVKLKNEHKQLGSEIEMALQAKMSEQEKGRKKQGELEAKVKKMSEELQGAKQELSGMAKLKADREGAMADVGALKQELVALSGKNAALKQEAANQKTAMEAATTAGDKALVEMKSAMGRNRNAYETLKVDLKNASAELRKAKQAEAEKTAQLDGAEEKVRLMAKEAEKPHQALMRSEESRRKAMEQVREANVNASKIESDLSTVKKAKIGLEELLFRKTDEVRGLKKRVKELETAAKKSAEAKPSDGEQESAAGLVGRG